MHILFVDDVADTRFLFSFFFRSEGHLTSLAADGLEAVAAVEQEQFDAIVMDIEMPRMDGWNATERIRHLPFGQRVPIIMFTGYAGEGLRSRALKVGATDLLHKPLLPGVLLSRILQLADR